MARNTRCRAREQLHSVARPRLSKSGGMSVNKLDTLLASLGLATMSESMAWAKPLLTGPFARPLIRLASLMDIVEYDTDHQMIHLRRRDACRLIPGQLFSVEIYVYPKKQTRLYAEYILGVDAAGNRAFRGSRLRPLTQRGLRQVLRDAKRVPEFHGRSHVTQPGELFADLGIDESGTTTPHSSLTRISCDLSSG